MAQPEPRSIPIRRAGNRDNLFLGGDREVVLFGGVLAAGLMFGGKDLLAFGAGIAVWLCVVHVSRLMAKSDPRLRHIWSRHRTYRPYYPPRATPFRINCDRQARRYR